MPVMLVVEDNIRYYSSFLPVIYTELISQSRRLHQRRLERRAQAGAHARASQDTAGSNYEEAAELGAEVSRVPAGGGAPTWSFPAAAS